MSVLVGYIIFVGSTLALGSAYQYQQDEKVEPEPVIVQADTQEAQDSQNKP